MNTLRLADGRPLGYAEFGLPTGRPVVFIHGTPGSRLEARLIEDAATTARVRLIAPERPGYGYSGFQPKRSLLNWPDDLAQLLDHLALGRVALIGFSGGGPHAAACALKLEQRLSRVALVGSAAPLSVPHATQGMSRSGRLFLSMARRMPWLTNVFMWQVRFGATRSPGGLRRRMKSNMSPADGKLLDRPDVWSKLREGYREGFRHGIRGAAWDLRIIHRAWPFDVRAIVTPVDLWHGEEDMYCPPAMGRYLAANIPNCRPHFLPGEGHLFIADRGDEVLRELLR